MSGYKKLSEIPSSLTTECSSFEASSKTNPMAMVERESSPNKIRQQCIKDPEIEILEIVDDQNTNSKGDGINTMGHLSMNLNNRSKSVIQQPGPIQATSTVSTTTFSFKTSLPKPVFGNTGEIASDPEILFKQPAKQKVGLHGSSFGSSLSAATFVFDSQNNQKKAIPFGAKPTDFVSVNTATFNPFSFSNSESGGFFQSAFSNYRETNRSKSDLLSKNTNNVGKKSKKGKRKFTRPPNRLANRVAEDLTLGVLRTETGAENNPYSKRMRMDTLSSPEELVSLNVNTNESEAHVVKNTITYKYKLQSQTNLNSHTNKDKRKTFTSNGEKLDSGLVPLQKSVENDTTLINGTHMNSEKSINNSNKTAHAGSSVSLSKNNVVAKERDVLSSIPKSSKHLRPIIIDGSNLATEHGKAMNSYSCKGIEISIKYFLRLGHKVIAFVPNSIRYRPTGGRRISDVSIIENLAKDQHVVFTPSRRFVGGNTVVCDERRYVVELAAKDGGVILSNHQFEDLKEESYSFKVAIEERLLMYCFVGDILMIPHDPMGRHGPFLNEFLSFPVKEES